MAATNAAIQNSMQQLAATTRLGVKKKVYNCTRTEHVFPDQTPTQTVSLIPIPRLHTKDRTSLYPICSVLVGAGPLSITQRPAGYHPIPRCLYHRMPHCVPPHAPLSTTPCPAGYHPMPRCLPPHAPLATIPYTHIWRSEGGACCGRGGENPTEACTYLRTGPGSRHGHGA